MDKRSTGKKKQVKLNILKAQEKLLMFKESPINTNLTNQQSPTDKSPQEPIKNDPQMQEYQKEVLSEDIPLSKPINTTLDKKQETSSEDFKKQLGEALIQKIRERYKNE